MSSKPLRPHRYLFLLRVSLGVLFLISGLNGLFNLFPLPQYSVEGEQFITALKRSGFFWTTLKVIEASAGILLLFGAMGQLAVLALVPISFGILLFHIFLSPQGAGLGYLVFALEIALLWYYRNSIRLLFRTPRGEHVASN